MAIKARPIRLRIKILCADNGDCRDGHKEEIKLNRLIQFPAQNGRSVDLNRRLHAAGNRRGMVDNPLNDELCGKGSDGEIDALNAQARDADDQPNRGCHNPASGQGQQEWHIKLGNKVCSGIGPDGHKRGMANG